MLKNLKILRTTENEKKLKTNSGIKFIDNGLSKKLIGGGRRLSDLSFLFFRLHSLLFSQRDTVILVFKEQTPLTNFSSVRANNVV